MTIPTTNWCDTCQEACNDHPTTCTICGTALGVPPASTISSSNSTTSSRTVVGDQILEDMRQASSDLREILGSLRGQVQNLDAFTRNLIEQQQLQQEQQWQEVPSNLLAPINVGAASKSRPTSNAMLAKIPRIVLDKDSTLFRQATLQIILPSSAAKEDVTRTLASKSFECVLGEFGSTGEHRLVESPMIVCSPLTGKGGLSIETRTQISNLRIQHLLQPGNGRSRSKVVAFMERGDGLTFVEKAIMAQKAGASALIIGNTTSTPWPFVMKDFKGEGEKHGLTIPVAMIKQADAELLLKQYHQQRDAQSGEATQNVESSMVCSLQIVAQARDCVVCCEELEASETVMQLPGCGHVFHEECAMVWLKSHNTCPSCRLELPTDDVEYETERRRQQRTHAGGHEEINSEWNGFYG